MENLGFSDQIKLVLYKWPDIASSALNLIMRMEGEAHEDVVSNAWLRLERDLDDTIVQPVAAFYEGLAEKTKQSMGGVPINAVIKPEVILSLDAISAKKVYVECINHLFDVLEAVTKTKYPRIQTS